MCDGGKKMREFLELSDDSDTGDSDSGNELGVVGGAVTPCPPLGGDISPALSAEESGG